ncbi:MAG: hypothetical protein IJP01_05200, partial [Oscillospiraceae bacterium]|nr:hypothetical protein [Oscillospiraceae bacterium]
TSAARRRCISRALRLIRADSRFAAQLLYYLCVSGGMLLRKTVRFHLGLWQNTASVQAAEPLKPKRVCAASASPAHRVKQRCSSLRV